MADLSIAIEILGKDSFSAAAGSVQKGVGGLLGGFKDLGLGIFGISQTFDVAKGAIEGLIGPAIDAQQVASQTAAVLKSTGGAAGLTADDISGLAGELSKLTPFEDEAIQSAENLLLTFTGIGGDIMPQATETVLNMSQALGQDLKSSSVQLGKALNDPIKGITALSRVGVAFTDEQKEQIKTMQEAGNIAGAQAIILKELGTEFGGAAKAAGQTFGGQMVILQTAVGNVAEAIGGPLIKGLSAGATAILPFVTAFADELPGAIDGFMASLDPVISGLGDFFNQVVGAGGHVITMIQALFAAFTVDKGAIGIVKDQIGELFGPDIAEGLDGFLSGFMDAIPAIQEFGAQVGYVFDVVGSVIQQVMGGDVEGALGDFTDGMSEILPNITGQLGAWAQAFLSWIGPMIPPLLQQLTALSIQIGTWLWTVALPFLVEHLAEWAAAFVDWVAPLIPPLLVQLGGLLQQVGSWLLTVALPSLAANLLKWGLAFVEWVAPRIPLLIGELLKLELALIAWTVTDALPAIVKTLISWGSAFVDWVAKDAMPYLSGKLAAILTGISDWVTQSLNSVAAQAGRLGAEFVQGIQQGIGGALGGLKNWVTDNLANALPQWVRDVLGIHSPSSVFADIGANMMRGLEQGIKAQWPSVEEVVHRLMGMFAGLGANVSGSAGDWLRAALAITGTPQDWFGDLYELMQMESGGNPRAVNPIEVLGQHASGLMQMLPSTFNAHKLDGFGDIWNPIDNAVSAIRYIKDQYGSVHNIDRSPAGGYLGYAEGGVVPGPPGMGQWAWVHGGETITPPGQGGGDTYVTVNVAGLLGGTPAQVARELESLLTAHKQRNGRLAFT